MKKVVIHRPGGFDKLTLETHADPVPGAGEVRVSTRAIGVNFADCIIRMGLYKSANELVGWPITPGFEFSGVVTDLGTGVVDLEIGNEVFGVTRFGGYATEVCVPRRQLRPMPRNLTLLEAGAFPTVFLTAWYALNEAAHLRAGSCVLIHSAAGGVGSAAVQLAKNAGAFVVGVVGAAHKVESVRRNGADAVIDKSAEDLWQAAKRYCPSGYHVVLEANGAETMRQSYAHLRPSGRLVVYGFQAMMTRGKGIPNWLKLAWDWLRLPRFNPLQMTDANKGVVAFNLSYLFDESALLEEALGTLLADLDSGRLRIPAVTTFPLEHVAEAHRALQSGDTVGKLVLVP